ncbi:hypothetical protein KsCSTR_38300 [Candidatus Kuenenia stuttgartiensis]|uniref:Uncharacterized protein n=1 Tax=Kuenenia stuttgartiensis TaxID=174633 RepID=Q1Q600_KUEST|nr:hypothetical protein KsCSTR_38300 [Candidatus Kuenenia stuttgartiensis]CAJ72993.1 unknown protein [Candidatus Kuenenia stuttgartiensis]
MPMNTSFSWSVIAVKGVLASQLSSLEHGRLSYPAFRVPEPINTQSTAYMEGNDK